MPQRGIETAIWSHVDFCGLSPVEKLLFLYLVTSFRGNAAGIYRVTVRQIAFDTGLQEAEVEPAMRRLAPMDIEWFPESQTVWVKRFLAHQAHSPQFLKRVGEDLEGMRRYPELVRRYIEYNTTVSIPYQYLIDAVPPSGSGSGSETVSESVSDMHSPIPAESDHKPSQTIFEHWNKQNIVQHRKLDDKTRRAIGGALAAYSETEIVQAIDNYARVLASPEHYFKYKWTLRDFLGRGLDKFMLKDVCWENYRKDHGGGNGANQQGTRAYGQPGNQPSGAFDGIQGGS